MSQSADLMAGYIPRWFTCPLAKVKHTKKQMRKNKETKT